MTPLAATDPSGDRHKERYVGVHSYARVRRQKALSETKKVWSSHQTLAFFAPGSVGLLVAVALRAFWPKLQDLNKVDTALLVVLFTIAGYVVSVVSSYIINYVWTVPADIYQEQEQQIATQRAAIHEQATVLEQERKDRQSRVLREIPTGEMNGSNTDFTLTNTPNPPASLDLWLNGIEQTNWYTLNGRVITFKFAPLETDEIIARYTY